MLKTQCLIPGSCKGGGAGTVVILGGGTGNSRSSSVTEQIQGRPIIENLSHFFSLDKNIMHYCVLQVSKTAPTGEYLTTGSFMIRGNNLT